MIIQKKVRISSFVTLGFFIASFLFNLIPCQIAADLPTPVYSWKMCSLNPDIALEATGKTVYLGLTESLFQTYLIIIGAVFSLTFLILTLLAREVNKGR